MDADFWHNKWQNNEVNFHQDEINPKLTAHWHKLSLTAGARVFVPLCGKTNDIAYLLAQGHQVVGAELSEIAIKQLFNDLGLSPTIRQRAGKSQHFTLYQAKSLTVWVGDIFELTPEDVGVIDACYDRAALVALPLEMRQRYAAQVIELTNTTPQLVLSVDYDQAAVNGPPFAVNQNELQQHYQQYYQIKLLEQGSLEGGMKGKVPAQHQCWLLQP